MTLPETVACVLLIASIGVGAVLSPAFLDAEYLLDTTSLYMEVGILALAMTLVIISGNIDLSVTSNLALTGVLTAWMYSRGVPMAVCVPLAVGIGSLLGLVNGLLITFLKLPSLTVTLGTLALYRGLAQVVAGDHSIGSFPGWFVGVDYWKLGGVLPAPLCLFLAMALVFGLVLHKTTFGRRVQAIGTNEPAAAYSGVPVDRVKLMLFAISGAMAGVGAVLMLSRLSVARYDHASGDELAVITAVVLGGTSIFGGRGTIFGTVAALFLLGMIRRAMGLANMTPDTQLAVTGILLVVAVLMAKLGQQRRL
jgi:rhamnose transport system permease protein